MPKKRMLAIILADPDEKPIKSDQPIMLYEVLFKPILRWTEDACRAAGIDEIIVVANDHAALLQKAVTPACRFVSQSQRDYLADGGDCLVIHGGLPLLDPQTIISAYEKHTELPTAVTVISTRPDETNPSVYWFDAKPLAAALEKAPSGSSLSGAIAAAAHEAPSSAYFCDDPRILSSVCDRRTLRDLNTFARALVIEHHLQNGVDIPFDDGIIIGTEVTIAPDTRILPGTILLGNTSIGAHCEIGPDSRLENATIGADSKIIASYLTDSTVGADTTIGPFTQLRPDSHIGNGVKIGDFVEIKNSTIGDQTSIAHLTYIGDSDVGKLCNFGCGVVTANYDGNKKHRTIIGDRAFIGCNTNLIPPITVGEGAYTAAGTTVDRDIPAGALSVGRARQVIKEGWADKNVQFKKDK